MKSFKRRDNDYFLTDNGENLFEIALTEAMSKKGIETIVTFQDFSGGEQEARIITTGKDAYFGQCGVEWHSRWCFYYMDKTGRNFLADFRNGKLEFCMGMHYNTEREAIESALKICGIM